MNIEIPEIDELISRLTAAEARIADLEAKHATTDRTRLVKLSKVVTFESYNPLPLSSLEGRVYQGLLGRTITKGEAIEHIKAGNYGKRLPGDLLYDTLYEARRALAAAERIKRARVAEGNRKMADALRGVPKSPEQNASNSEGARRRWAERKADPVELEAYRASLVEAQNRPEVNARRSASLLAHAANNGSSQELRAKRRERMSRWWAELKADPERLAAYLESQRAGKTKNLR